MRLPERTSNSLTSPEPSLLTLNVVGPALLVSFGGQPSSSIVTFTVLDFAACAGGATSASVATAVTAQAAARPILAVMEELPFV
jgi:hypothetical protein